MTRFKAAAARLPIMLLMAQRKRAKGRRDPKSGHVDPFYDRRKRFESLLRPLGLAERFARMPRKFQELFWRFKMPDLAFDFPPEVSRGPLGKALGRAVEAVSRAASVEVEGSKVAVRDFLAVMGGLKVMLEVVSELSKLPPAVKEFHELARPRVQQCLKDYFEKAFIALHQAVSGPMLAYTQLDSRLLTVNFKTECNARGRIETRMVFALTKAESRRISLDGADRPVYRVPTALGGNEVKWLSWPADRLGRGPAQAAEYPVYVQSHALRQLSHRLNVREAQPFLEGWLAHSLNDPVIVERRGGGTLLIEYRIKDWRVGYLVAKVVEDAVVVRTFLFVTMEGTPESRKLERRLKLTRRDLEWLGLNDLAAFTKSDLHGDEELRRLLGECGCGHLLEIEAGDFAASPRAIAAELRQYVGMAA